MTLLTNPPDPAVAAGIGTPADAGWPGTGASTMIAALKGAWAKLEAVRLALTGTLSVAVQPAASAPADFSANPATVPLSGLVLLTTIPAAPARQAIEVQNQSAGALQLVRDDGAANASTIMLSPGSGAGQQGASWSSRSFKGRVRIYGASGAQVSAWQE